MFVRFMPELISLLCYTVFHHMNISHSIYSVIEGHLDCVLFGLPHTSSVAINVLIPTLSTFKCISVGYTHGIRISRL